MLYLVDEFAPVIQRHGSLFRVAFEKKQNPLTTKLLFEWLSDKSTTAYMSKKGCRHLDALGSPTLSTFRKRSTFYLVDKRSLIACKLAFSEILGTIGATTDLSGKGLKGLSWTSP